MRAHILLVSEKATDEADVPNDPGRAMSRSAGGWQEIFTHFETGHVKTKKNKKGTDETLVNYEYDDLWREKKRDFPSGTDTEFETDAAGRQTKMKDASGEKRRYYDDADRLIKVEQGPVGFVVGTDQNCVLEFAWNAASQRTQVKLTVRTQSAKVWDMTYTDDGQLDKVTNPDGDETKHEYLTDNRPKKITLRFQSASAKSTREVFYQDTSDSHAYVSAKNSHLRKVLDKKQAGTVISSFEYELDAAGNRLGVTDSTGKYTQFGIDPKRQLVSETKWSAKTPGTKEWQYLFQYDPNQNRIFLHKDGVATPYTYGDNNEMTAAGADSFTYDHFGNAKTKVVSGNTTTFGWSFESELLSIDYPGTSADDSHEYDGNHLRMRSKLAGAANWTNFVWDELTHELLAEYTLISGTFTIKALNTYGLGLVSSNREGTKRYFHFDALGSTAALDDENETLKDSYTYEAFGVVQSSTSTNGPSVNPFRFHGQRGTYDSGAMGSTFGLYFSGSDAYDASTAQRLGSQNRAQVVRGGCGALKGTRGACIAALCSLSEAAAIIGGGLGAFKGLLGEIWDWRRWNEIRKAIFSLKKIGSTLDECCDRGG